MINKAGLNKSRAVYYGILSKLLTFSYKDDRFFGVKESLPYLIENPLDENSRDAMQRLYKAFNEQGEEAFVKEYDQVFHLISNKIVRNTASYYDDGIEGGKKQLEVKNFLAKTKIRRDEKNFKEPEDSVGFLLVFMYELTELILEGKEEYASLGHCLFSEVINPFIDTFINEMFNHPCSDLYKDVAILLNAFMEFERLYFEVEKVGLIDLKNPQNISRSESERREKNKAKRDTEKRVKNAF
ncbi:MAG: molecular chaperone [Campylobacteraceae bacterium]